MDEARYAIRPYVDADIEADVRIANLHNPERRISAAEVRGWLKVLETPGLFHRFLVAEERSSSQVVAVGLFFHAAWAFSPDRYAVAIYVDPAHESRGIGLRLQEELSQLAASRKAKALTCQVRSDIPRCVRFSERAGFVERRRTWSSRLDLRAVRSPDPPRPPRAWAAEGLQFTTLAQEGPDRPEVRERLYRLHTESGQDVPRVGPASALTFDQFCIFYFDSPGFLPEGIFVARSGDVYVSMTTLGKVPDDPSTLHIGFTGTLRSYRGRGIASEIKRQAVEFAKARGYRYLLTMNDSLNTPIWTINQRLGFRQETVWIQGEKLLDDPGSQSAVP